MQIIETYNEMKKEKEYTEDWRERETELSDNDKSILDEVLDDEEEFTPEIENICERVIIKAIKKASLKASLDRWREELEDKLKERKFLSKLDNIWAEQNDNFENPLLDRIHILVSNRFDELLKEIEELKEIINKEDDWTNI